MTGDLTPVPFSKVQGIGEAVVQLNGDVATVSLKTNGLLNSQHAMHFHAGARGECPPERPRTPWRPPGISDGDGLPWYGPPVTALTTSGDTSPEKSLLAFTRYPERGQHRLPPALQRRRGGGLLYPQQERRRDRPWDRFQPQRHLRLLGLDRSELKRSLPAETTAPGLCGPLVPASTARLGKKTGRVPGRAADLYSFARTLERPRRRARAASLGGCAHSSGDGGSAEARVTRRATFLVVAVAAAGASWHSFCPDAFAHGAPARGTRARRASVAVQVARTKLGPILVDGRGHTLYLFLKDREGKSSCYGTARRSGRRRSPRRAPLAGQGVAQAKLSTTRRKDHERQLVYNGHPLYAMGADKRPGEMAGQGFLGTWFVVSPAGRGIGKPRTSAADQY